MSFKKISFTFAAVALMMALVAGCAPAAPAATQAAPAAATQAPAATQEQFKVGLLSPGPVNDKGWNQLAYDGVKAIESELGAKMSYVELPDSPTEFEKAFTDYASQGYDLVIGHGYQFEDAMAKVAPQFPDTVFVTSGGTKFGPNYGPMIMKQEEPFYLLGLIAANMTKTGKALGVGGQDIPAISGPFAGFKQGFESVSGNTFNVTYLNNWTDVGAAKEAALAGYNDGADFFIPNANIAGLGVFQAAQEKDFYAFGANGDQSAEAPDQILASSFLSYTQGFVNLAKAIQAGAYVGNQPVLFGLKDEGVVGIVYNDKIKGEIPADVLAKVDEAIAKIKSGEIVVEGTYIK